MKKEERNRIIENFLSTQPFLMLKDRKGCFLYPFVDPGAGYDSNLWDWDSYFSVKGLFEICEYFKEDPTFPYAERWKATVDHAKGCVLNFLSLQLDDGFIPMACTSERWYAKDLYEAHDYGNPVNQHKPFLCQNALNISEHIGDFSWVSVDKLVKYIEYYYAHQYDENTGLFFWQNDVMIGIDNNPTVFGRPENSSADIYLNCFMYAELNALCTFLAAVGDDRLQKFQTKKNYLKIAINELMYDERDSLYYSVDLLSKTRPVGIYHKNMGVIWKGIPLKIRIWASILPMMVGISSKQHNDKMVERHFYDPKFVGKYGVASVSQDEKMFDERPSGNPSNWLGPVWIIANYCVWKGLKENGYQKEAEILKEKILDLVGEDIKLTGHMSESYSFLNGKPIMNGGFLSWNCLVIEMLREKESGANRQ